MDPTFEQAIGKFTTEDKTVEIILEVARTPEKIAKGLMNRYFLASGAGMVFLHGKESTQSFWMLNTDLPLSIAFYDKNGIILDIQDMKPYSLDAHAPKSPYVGAIEVNRGLFEKIGVKPGDKVEIVEENHPVMLNEDVLYDGEYAKATHAGLVMHEHGQKIDWADVDKKSLGFDYPRLIKSKDNNNRNFLGFRTLSFVNTGAPRKPKTLTPEQSQNIDLYYLTEADEKDITSNLTNPPQSFVRRYTDPESAQSGWDHLFRSDGPVGRAGVNFSSVVSNLVRATKQAIHGEHPLLERRYSDEELNYRANFFPHRSRAVTRVGEHLGFSTEASSQAVGHLSPTTPWNLGNSPHQNNVDTALHAFNLVDMASKGKLKLTQEHIDALKEGYNAHHAELQKTNDLRKLIHVDKTKVPTSPGTYSLDDIDDVALATLLTGQNTSLDRIKAIASLTSERRPDHPAVSRLQRPVEAEDFLGSKYKTGKVSSFIHSIRHPLTSLRATWDTHLKRLGVGKDLGNDVVTKIDESSDWPKRGAPEGQRRAPGAAVPSYDHDTPRGKWRSGAGYMIWQSASEEADSQLRTSGITDAPFMAQHSLQWYEALTDPNLQGNEERIASILKESQTPPDQIHIPDRFKGHDEIPSSQQDRFCREIHPMRDLMKELNSKADHSGLFVVRR